MSTSIHHLIRWALLPAAVMALFGLSVLISVAAYQLTGYLSSEFLCPQVEGQQLCTEDYLGLVKESLLFLMPAIAAVLMIYAAYQIAPSHKLVAAVFVFTVGFLVAISYALDSGYWHTLAMTELLSGITLFYLYKKIGVGVDK